MEKKQSSAKPVAKQGSAKAAPAAAAAAVKGGKTPAKGSAKKSG